ncbi:MAG TPA: hypothetical protein VK472_05550 [Allosphingosinicella sp.]|nr:hypothetical protein [Allosphingosinicella sp.]
MRPGLELLIAPALLLLVSSCADDKWATEIACQQRLVDVPGQKMKKAGPGEIVVASSFAQLSRTYAEMPLDGCTEAQAYAARSLSRRARHLADTGVVAERSLHAAPSLKEREAFMNFAAGLEQFENRRRVLREELVEMKADRR